MKIRNNYEAGYSETNAVKLIGKVDEAISITQEPIIVYKTENGQTDFTKIVAVKGWFAIKNLQEPILIKFSPNVTFPSFGQRVEFQDLQACVVKDNCYFRAENVLY